MENKPRLNLMDILIILVIAAVITFGVYFVSGNSGSTAAVNNADLTAEYQIQFVEREKAIADAFVAAKDRGDIVFVGEKERAEAVIKDVLVEPATRYTMNMEKGEITETVLEGLYDVTVTLQSKAQETDTEIQIGGVSIKVGTETAVKGKGYAGYGFVIDLKLVD